MEIFLVQRIKILVETVPKRRGFGGIVLRDEAKCILTAVGVVGFMEGFLEVAGTYATIERDTNQRLMAFLIRYGNNVLKSG